MIRTTLFAITLAILAIPAAAAESDLATQIVEECAGLPSQPLRQQCLDYHIKALNRIVTRAGRHTPDLLRACRIEHRDRLIAIVECLALPGEPL